MYAVHDWPRSTSHHVEGLSKQRSPQLVAAPPYRLLGLAQPPRYERTPVGSKLDPFVDQIGAMLREDPGCRQR